jgi:hypothetical protein
VTEKSESLLSKLHVGPQQVPPRICFYGTHGIGKSTLAAMFPKPIFISTEDGLASMDVTSFPRAEHVNDVEAQIRTLIKEEHDFKTVVIDSVDWLCEPLITGDIEARYDAKDLAYGKAQVFVAESLREIFGGLDVLRKKRGMNVVLIAHAVIQKYDDPVHESYDRFLPKLPRRANEVLCEWVDVLAFCAFRVIVKKSENGFNQSTRGITTGERLVHFIERPAFMAKNRYGCPDNSQMTFENIEKLIPISK